MQIVSIAETICNILQILFSGNNKKNVINLSSANKIQRVVKIKLGFIDQEIQELFTI